MNDTIKPTGYNLTVTPSSIEDKTDKNGKPYLNARVSLERKGKDAVVRTVKAEGKAREALIAELAVGKTSVIRGFFSKIANDNSTAEFITAYGMPKAKAA